MAVKIKFDNTHNVISPTFVLATRSGRKLGVIPATNITVSDAFNSRFELEFEVHKYDNGASFPLWNRIVDFSIIWCREWDVWFQAEVTLQEGNGSIKQVSCSSLGEAELSQVYLYGQEYNTEDDISREDYVPTHLYDAGNPSASLLTRIMEKVPHYSIRHVDDRIASIQRTFSFDKISIYDAFQEIAEEVDCIFVIDSGSDSDGSIKRSVSVYDLEAYCVSCHKRGIFDHRCSECGSTDVLPGYGEDTAIFISDVNLAEEISLKTDTGSVKNCFRLECGDDLMTATVRNCNPNGSQYIWYISDETKDDMSDELVTRLQSYDTAYAYYNEEYSAPLSATEVNAYNLLIQKYDSDNSEFSPIDNNIVGYPNLINRYYDTINFYMYLNDELMPSIEMTTKTALTELALLTSSNIPNVAVQKLSGCSLSTATNAVLSVAKSIVDSSFKVVATNTSYNAETKKWKGKFTVTSYSDEEQTASSQDYVEITITDNYELYVKQRIHNVLKKETSSKSLIGIENLFDLSVTLETFSLEIKKYCLTSLKEIHDSCETCVNLMIDKGVADKKTWGKSEGSDLYDSLYEPYYERLMALQNEIKIREGEISTVLRIQSAIDEQRELIQDALNFESYLGNDLWLEFIAYRREDVYRNENYVSDGLNNAEIFDLVQEFIETAKKEIFKSATRQHSLTASLKNLLAIKEFKPIVDMFAVGNWIRVQIDGEIYKLRLISYTIDFNDLENLSVEFSDVKKCVDGVTDSASIMSQASSMASSYGGVTRQAKKGEQSNKKIGKWVNDGLALTNMKIVNDSDNQNISMDNHGLLCREYLPVTDSYDDKQLKIINKGLYITDDNWRSAKAGVGNFNFYNPKTGEYEEGYGVIADKLIGNVILSEEVGIYNENNTIALDQNGLTIITKDDNSSALTVKKEIHNQDGDIVYDDDGNPVYTTIMGVDSNGNLELNGAIKINTDRDENEVTIDDLADPTRFDGRIHSAVKESSDKLENAITVACNQVRADADNNLSNYKSQVGQYMSFGENGLILGASDSNFKTAIDNQRLAFLDGDDVAAYINNRQLCIPNAVVEKSLWIGGFVFIPREDGSVSLVWQEN